MQGDNVDIINNNVDDRPRGPCLTKPLGIGRGSAGNNVDTSINNVDDRPRSLRHKTTGDRKGQCTRGNKVDIIKDNANYWAIQRSWFARVNALCNLSRKKSREVAAHFRADF